MELFIYYLNNQCEKVIKVKHFNICEERIHIYYYDLHGELRDKTIHLKDVGEFSVWGD